MRTASQVVWAPVTWLGGHYEVSTAGEMRSVDRFVFGKRIRGRVLKLGKRSGYPTAYARFEGRHISMSVHRVVARVFIPNPENKPEVNHKDGDRANNHVSNLEWVTHAENCMHAWDMGLQTGLSRSRGNEHYKAKVTEEQVRAIRAGSTETFGLTKSGLRHIKKGRSWRHVKYA